MALTDPRLSLFSGDEEQFDSYNDRPQHKITNFRYYTLLAAVNIHNGTL